jgi:hypothetical protein
MSAISEQKSRMLVEIRSPGDLAQVHRSPWRLHGQKRIVLCAAEADLSPEMRDRFERRLNTLYNDCGCATGAIFLLVGLAASAAWIILAGRFTFTATGLGFLLAIAFSLVGKLAGLTISSWRLDCAIRELRQVWRNGVICVSN